MRDPAHCPECRALVNLEASLKRLSESWKAPLIDRDLLRSLAAWFDLTRGVECALSDFCAYAEALGCVLTKDGYDLLTPENLSESWHGLRSGSRPESVSALEDQIDARVSRFIGTHQDVALRRAAAALNQLRKEK